MGDQERPAPGYESSLPQKAANLDSKVPIQMTHKCNAKPADSTTGGYYLNVAQKGKLILPTALWILLIIAGVSFITLLATLNKSINTLDALVELEQEKEALAISDHLQEVKLGQESERYFKKSTAKPKKGAKKHEIKHLPEQRDVIQVVDLSSPQTDANWLLPIEPSWFAMPSWTSLEPVRRQPPVAQPMPPMGLLDEMMRGAAPGAPDTIIIQDGPMEEPPLGLLNSFMKQLAPVFDRLTPGGSGDVSGTIRISEQADSPAAISAKIDNLNVHINPEQTKPMSRQDEVNSLEKSIDELVDKLMASSHSVPPKSVPHHQVHRKRPHAAPIGPMFSPLAELAPFQRPQNAPDAMFLQVFGIDGPQPLEQNGRKKLGAPTDELPEGQLIISISGEPELGKPSGEINRHHVSNTRRPQVGHSPYEHQSQNPAGDFVLFSPFEMKAEHRPMPHHRHRPDHHIVKPGKPAETPWELLANEMAEGLLEDALKQQNKQPNLFGKPDVPQFIIIDDTAPLAPGEQPNVQPTIFRPENLAPMFEPPAPPGAHKSANSKPSPVDEMFNALFAPAPGSKLAGAEPTKQPNEIANQSSSSIPKVDSTTVIISEEPTTTSKAATTEAPTSASSQTAPVETEFTLSSTNPTMSPEAKKEVDSIISQLTKEVASSPDEIDHRSADESLQDFMRPLFTLAQMSDGQQSASTEPGSSSSAKSSDVVTTPTTTSTTPTTTSTSLPLSTTPIPEATNATTLSGESTVNSIFSKVIGLFKDQRPANQAEEPKTATASASTTPAPQESATKLTPSVANAPLLEVVEEQEALDQLPAIDLSPFAKSRKPFDRASEKSSDLAVALSSSPTSSKPQPSTGGLNQDASPASSTTTSRPKLVTVSEAQLDAEANRSKSFLQKANDVLERQILGLKRFLNVNKA